MIEVKKSFCPNTKKWLQVQYNDGTIKRIPLPCKDLEHCKACRNYRGSQFTTKFFNRTINAGVDLSNFTTLSFDGPSKKVREIIRYTSKKLKEDVHKNKLLQFTTNDRINYLIEGDVSAKFVAEMYQIDARREDVSINDLKSIIGKAYKNYSFTGLLYNVSEDAPLNHETRGKLDAFLDEVNNVSINELDTYMNITTFTDMLLFFFDNNPSNFKAVAKKLLTSFNPVLNYISKNREDGWLLKKRMRNILLYNYTDLQYQEKRSEAIDQPDDDFVMEDLYMCTNCFKVVRESQLYDMMCSTCNHPYYGTDGIELEEYGIITGVVA